MAADKKETHAQGGEGNPNISKPLTGPSTESTVASHDSLLKAIEARQRQVFDNTLRHGGSRSLDSISLHALCLGLVLASCAILAAFLAHSGHQIWRLPQFIATLSLFHFLEFYTTARWNTPAAAVSSFLLFSNGTAYNIAHACAMLEIITTSLLTPGWQASCSRIKLVALVFMIVGQSIRSVAMAQAGTNFNHIPARQKANDHVLVTKGVYAFFRHPSYFGFFWWAIGTQLFVGNAFCATAYTLVLWRFFKQRIVGEERFLMEFFGQDYKAYKARTRTWIPFIR